MRQPLGPGGVGEGDVIEVGPAGKDPLLSDKAVVIAPAAPLVVDVGRALIGALRLVVVVGQAAGWGTAAAVAGWHHAIDVDSVTQLHRDHHGEPAGAEP